MKKLKVFRIAGYFFLSLLIIVLSALGFIWFFLPRISVPELKVELTQAHIERGRYLANHVTVCIDCHSSRDWSKFSGPIIPGSEGKGGEKFGEEMGFPGTFFSPNITQYALSGWSDGELYRAITSGVTNKSKPIFPVMPCGFYGKMATEDVYCIIAYIRSLSPIKNDPPKSNAKFPVNIFLHLMPKEPAPLQMPVKSESAEYGKYLVDIAACIDCHTPFEKNEAVISKAFSGGREFPMPGGKLISTNITPDKETGIGLWSKQMFIDRFKAYDLTTYVPNMINKGDVMTIMPWTMYAGMDTTDLGAVYTYLASVTPLKNSISRWTPAK